MSRTKCREAKYDIDRVRDDFPILGSTVNGHPLAYLDNAASAQKPTVVVERMVAAMYADYANVHRGSHSLGNAATAAFEDARECVRHFLNANDASEVVFTKSATEAVNLVANSLGSSFRPGDEVVLSVMEHHANLVPWHMLRARHGAVLRWVDVAEDGNLSVAAVEEAMTARTRLVAITHMSNVLGAATPLGAITAAAHARGVPVLADGAQAAVHMPVDVQALDVDFYAITGHKLYGPTGIGALYGKRTWLDRLPPFLGGGEMVDTVARDAVTYADPPHRFEAGTPPIVEAIGLGAALNYMDVIGRERIAAHEQALGIHAHRRLSTIKGLSFLGRASPGPILSFVLANAHPHDVAALLDAKGICIRAGGHCAHPLHERFGVQSSCRASFGMYTSFEEVDRLAGGLEEAADFLAHA
jgi:cysteine desulfurase/selenocysteine lyase